MMSLFDKVLLGVAIGYGFLTAKWIILLLIIPYITVTFMVQVIISYAKHNYPVIVLKERLKRDLKAFSTGSMLVWIIISKVCYFSAWIYIGYEVSKKFFGVFA